MPWTPVRVNPMLDQHRYFFVIEHAAFLDQILHQSHAMLGRVQLGNDHCQISGEMGTVAGILGSKVTDGPF